MMALRGLDRTMQLFKEPGVIDAVNREIGVFAARFGAPPVAVFLAPESWKALYKEIGFHGQLSIWINEIPVLPSAMPDGTYIVCRNKKGDTTTL